MLTAIIPHRYRAKMTIRQERRIEILIVSGHDPRLSVAETMQIHPGLPR